MAQGLMWFGCGSIFATMIFAPLSDMLGRRVALGLMIPMYVTTYLMLSLELAGIRYIYEIPYAYPGAFFFALATFFSRQAMVATYSHHYQEQSVVGMSFHQLLLFGGTAAGFLVLPQLSIDHCLALMTVSCVAATGFAVTHKPVFEALPPVQAKRK
eukprot:gnl/MRDRNA2_/MRDRNA2_372739_c0_seq1.p1 gnl/MRDRNA2_/MRDRNA2_372739_c0~~gnl/MRDRNA2_/MRDRNA2_372739_c0_seq1.p1  ORF type:complete len:177 (+),score=18.85 gnl/MRDRNA2_/MRDRNA2_372739_c0_seq1:66-533(+)